jgi:hypothetical protein
MAEWIKQAGLKSDDFVFPSRIHDSPHLGTLQYARILEGWVEELGLDPADYGTHSMRRTKATLIYRRTKNLRAVQLLLGHSKLESTVRYLGIEVDDRNVLPVVPGLLVAYPKLEMEVSLDSRTVDLVSDGYDIGIRGGRAPDSSLVSRRVCAHGAEIEFDTACASPSRLVRR